MIRILSTVLAVLLWTGACFAQEAPVPGQSWTEPATGMEFLWVPAASFHMGCGPWAGECRADELPAHPVAVSGFWMAKYEATRAQWQALWGIVPKLSEAEGALPVTDVTWNEAARFAEELSARTGLAFALPTEAQWEYAARSGGREEVFAGQGWQHANASERVHPVGELEPNGLGLYDMSGNVWEWCRDRYDPEAYGRHQAVDPFTDGEGERVRRGGAWTSPEKRLSTVYRSRAVADYCDIDLGFRLVLLP